MSQDEIELDLQSRFDALNLKLLHGIRLGKISIKPEGLQSTLDLALRYEAYDVAAIVQEKINLTNEE